MRLARSLVACAMLAGCTGPLAVRPDVVDAQALGRLECVGVLPFDNATRTDGAGRIVAQSLAHALLSSGRVNVLGPDEAGHLLDLMAVPGSAGATAQAGLLYGRALGVDAVLVGTVTEFQTPGAGGIKQPVIGFVAELVETTGGRVVWSAATSNYHHAVVFDVAEPRAELLRDAAASTVASWVDARGRAAPFLGPCGELQTKLWRGELKPAAVERPAVEQMGSPGAPAVGSPDTIVAGAGSAANGATTTSSLQSPAAGGAAPSVGPAAATPPPSGSPDLPPLPDVPSGPDAAPSPAPAPVAGAAALPPLPGDLPPLPGDLPAMPPQGAVERGAIAALSPARSPGAAPAALVAKLTPAGRDAARKLYGNGPIELAGVFPNFTRGVLTLSPKATKLFDGVGAVMRSSPTLAVRITVRVPSGSPTDASLQSIATQQAALVRGYFGKAGYGADRVDVVTAAKPLARGKKAGKKDNVVSLAVLRY